MRESAAVRHPDLVRRGSKTPNRPDAVWVADFTYVWTACGFVYVSFLTDVYSRRILGWRVSPHKTVDLVTAALTQALATPSARRRRLHRPGDHPPPIGCGFAIHSAGVHRGASRSGYCRLDRHRRGCAGQRVDGIDDRAVQDRGHHATLPSELEWSTRGRARVRRMGALIQPRENSFFCREHAAS